METGSFSAESPRSSNSSPESSDDSSSSSSKSKKKLGASVARSFEPRPPEAPVEAPPADKARTENIESLLRKLQGKTEATTEKAAEPIVETATSESALKQAAETIIEPRQAAAEAEYQQADKLSPEAAAAAAHVALLRTMQERLATAGEPVAESLDAAEAEVAEMISDEPEADTPEAEAAEPDVENEPEAAEADETPQPAAVPPTRPPAGPPTTPTRPAYPGPLPAPAAMPFPGSAAPATGSFAPLPSKPEVVTVVDRSGERGAFGLGLLVGGVVGYFGGRRRGRRQGAKTAEKQAAPERRKLREQVQQLQATITGKERRITDMAQQHAAEQSAAKRRSLSERLYQVAPVIEKANSRNIEPSVVGRILVEAPVAVAAAVVAERARNKPAAKKEVAPIVPFDKKVEQFTKPELLATAEKIVVQGISLREMNQLGRVDEPGLRRVVGEFLKGGDVTKALNRELSNSEELKYERDPTLRQQRTAGRAGLQAVGVGSGGLRAMDTSQATLDTQATRQAPTNRPGPTPDDATIRRLRNQQLATLVATIIFVAILVLMAFLLT